MQLNDVQLKLVEVRESDQDPRIIEVHYPNVIPVSGYMEPKVQVEIGCRSLREPFSIQAFGSLVDEHYPDKAFTQTMVQQMIYEPNPPSFDEIMQTLTEVKERINNLPWEIQKEHLLVEKDELPV